MIAASYLRKSTSQDVAAAEKSIEFQRDHMASFVGGKGWTLSPEHEFVDDGVSGAEFARRGEGGEGRLLGGREQPEREEEAQDDRGGAHVG